MSVRRVVVSVGLVVGLGVGLAPAAGSPAAGADAERYVERIFASVTVTRDITYGAAPDEHGARQQLELDLYEPAGDTLDTRPAIVLAHGGSFYTGNKGGMAGLATAYARRGFVAMSIEYRMDEGAGPVRFPPGPRDIVRILDAKHDMQAAVRWARAQAGTHGIDPQRISVGGSSAGAVMAVVVATTPDDPGASGTPGPSSRVCTAVALAGAGDPALVDADDAGAIFFHGDRDTTVPYSQAVATKEAMDAAGLAAELVTFPGVGHGLGEGERIEQESAEWLKARAVDRETGCAGPAVAANASFVRAAHQDLLGRPATDGEVLQQAGYLDAGGTRSTLLGRLTSSDEWLGSIVTGFYVGTLGRPPDAAGLAYWVGTLRSGRFTVAQVAASFYASAEYHGRFGPPGRATTAAWVTDLYREILDRAPSAADVDYWVGRAGAHGRSWVAVRLYGSLESRQDRVAALYLHLLGRTPEPDGLAYWAGRIATAGDLSLARHLAASTEYGTRAVARFPG